MITLIVLTNCLTKDWRTVTRLGGEKDYQLHLHEIGRGCSLVKATVLITTGIDHILYRSEFVILNYSRCDLWHVHVMYYCFCESTEKCSMYKLMLSFTISHHLFLFLSLPLQYIALELYHSHVNNVLTSTQPGVLGDRSSGHENLNCA